MLLSVVPKTEIQGIKLIMGVPDLYSQTTKCYLKKLKPTSCSLVERLNIVRMLALQKYICSFSEISNKIPVPFEMLKLAR